MNICKNNLCTGCGACYNVCQNDCISMKEDKFGVIHPYVDESNCIKCNLCINTCPQNKSILCHLPLSCYASYRKNEKLRADSASGGIASALYESFLRKWNIQGRVYGVCYDNELKAHFRGTNNFKDIAQFRGSKYVQANTKLIYRDIENNLENGIHVLFIGTPCQVSGCLKYLNIKHIKQDNLITIDLLCHGVSPQKYLTEQIEYLKHKYKWNNVYNLTFRSNRLNKNFHFVIQAEKDIKSVLTRNSYKQRTEYNKVCHEDPYFMGFLKGITLRESCYRCKYSCGQRVGDLTIGDFIGLSHQYSSTPYSGKIENTSMILVNTYKGDKFLKMCKEDIIFHERPIQEAIEGGSSLQNPFPIHVCTSKFKKYYIQIGFIKAMYKVAGQELLINKLKVNLKKPIKKLIFMSGIDVRKVKAIKAVIKEVKQNEKIKE